MKNGSEWQTVRRMTPAQLKAQCVDWEISAAKLGRFIGMSPRRLRRIMKDEYRVRRAEVLLINLMRKHGERPL